MAGKKNISSPPGSPQVIGPVSIPSEEAFGTPILWDSFSFALEWFSDALNEARRKNNHQARRREIVFAVCFAESYLFEWVRDEVLHRDFKSLNQFFLPGEQRGAAKKWKDVPKALLAAGPIKDVPNLGQPWWEDWLNLVDMRNGLIHARASRPGTSSQPESERPFPSKSDLDGLNPGWAVNVVVKLARELHAAVGTSAPRWLVEP